MSRLWKGCRSAFMDVTGVSGGLTISSNTVDINLDNFMATRNSISAHFHPIGTNIHGRITNVYCPHLSDKKLGSWIFSTGTVGTIFTLSTSQEGTSILLPHRRKNMEVVSPSPRNTSSSKSSLTTMALWTWRPTMTSTPRTTVEMTPLRSLPNQIDSSYITI